MEGFPGDVCVCWRGGKVDRTQIKADKMNNPERLYRIKCRFTGVRVSDTKPRKAEYLEYVREDIKKVQPLNEAGGHAPFGKDVLDIIKEQVCKACGDDTIYELADLAVKHKLLEYVAYNKELHGEELSEYAEDGDMIYWWGNQEL